MNRSTVWLHAALLALLSTAAAAAPAIRPAFSATCMQGKVCVAPAVVRLDAGATTADGVARPFHELAYRWDCGGGDAKATRPAEPLSVCVYDVPGTYTVTLTVEHAGAEASETARVVVGARTAVKVVELPAGSRQPTVVLGPGPGLLTTKGSGAPAVLTNGLAPPDGWTIARVDFDGDGVSIAPERSGITLVDVRMRNLRNGGVVSLTGGGAKHSDRIAIARSEIHSAPDTHMPGIFLRAERVVLLDTVVDGGPVYNVRFVHFPGLLLAGSRIESLGPGANAVQLRGWSMKPPPGLVVPPSTASSRFVVAKNTFVADTPGTAVVRTCQTNTCDESTATAADVSDGIFADNVLRVTGKGRPPPSIGFWLAGGDLTVRDNRIECPHCDMRGPGTVRAVEHLNDSTRKTGLAHDRLTVEGNRLVLPEGDRAVSWLERGQGSDHVERNNTLERAGPVP
jgi:PKD repeat protein